MRTFELRVYRLRSQRDLDFYKDEIYPRHLRSFPLHGVEAHGFWVGVDDPLPRLFVLVSYAPGADVAEVTRRYMASAEFAADTEGFDVSSIQGVDTTLLAPTSSSPLQ